MSPRSSIGRWFFPALYFVFLFFSVVLWVSAGSSRAPRSGGVPATSAVPLILVPPEQASRYAAARDRMKRGGLAEDWVPGTLRVYLSLAGKECRANTESEFLACLPRAPVAPPLARLAMLRGSELASRRGMVRLARRFREVVDLTVNDPISRKVFAARLHALRENGELEEARKLAEASGALKGYEASLARAKLFARLGQGSQARSQYFQAARETRSRFQLRSALRELRRDYPELFRSTGPHTRDLLLFAAVMERAGLDELRVLPASEIIATTNPERADGDAFFFLRTFQARHLPALADRLYTHLSHNPDVLFGWLAQLGYDSNDAVAALLFKKFEHTRRAHRSIWRLHINHLERTGQGRARFREIVDYLAVHHADYQMYDELIERLIGRNHAVRAWAPEADWKHAIATIPPRTTRGRLVFWYHEYLRSRGQKQAGDQVRDEFYAMAPGSYYAHVFWDQRHAAGEDRDFEQAWSRVRNRADYLRWVGRYGGNDDALRFLAGRNKARFLDPEAVRFWDTLRNARLDVAPVVYDLYRLGESALAQEFFEDAFRGRLSEVELLARQADIGIRTGILYLSVYHTRQLLRARHIPEDPFSLPEGLLKTLYPRPYFDTAKRRAEQYGIDPHIVYAVMRQESMFRESAVSRSNARGLMQVMPSTGRWLAQRLRIRSYDLHKPDTSIQFGSMFFADMLRENGGDFRWAAIAYNGGPGNLRRWKRRYYRGDLNHFLEFIPTPESRDYCRIVFRNYQHYRAAYTLYP